jgi:hypothetical protein
VRQWPNACDGSRERYPSAQSMSNHLRVSKWRGRGKGTTAYLEVLEMSGVGGAALAALVVVILKGAVTVDTVEHTGA